MSMVMPSFDAFLSNTLISGSNKNYTPRSLPCITNQSLFCSLLINHSEVGLFNTAAKTWFVRTASTPTVKPVYFTEPRTLNLTFPSSTLTESELSRDGFDFKLLPNVPFLTLSADREMYVRLTQTGRYWYTVLRGLGYTCDPFDTHPVSILPLWAFTRAYYDLYYPKRFNAWHSSNCYNAINRHYNGYFTTQVVGGLSYDIVEKWDCLKSLFGFSNGFDFYATVDDNLVTAATNEPINYPSAYIVTGKQIGRAHV